jgi:hypothetical protein
MLVESVVRPGGTGSGMLRRGVRHGRDFGAGRHAG